MNSSGVEYRRNFGAQALGRLLYVAGSAAVFIAATHLMAIDAVGHYAFALAFLTVIWSFADLGTTAALGTLLAGCTPAERQTTLSSFVVLRVGVAVLAGLVGMAVAAAVVPGPVRAVTVAACAMTPLLAARFYEPIFQVCGKPGLSAILGIVYLVALLSTALPVLALFPQRPDLLVAAHVVAGVAYAAIGFTLSYRLLPMRLRVVWPELLTLLSVAGPIGVAGLLSMLSFRIGAMALGLLAGAEALAIFFAAQRFLELGAAIAATAITPLFSIIGRLGREGDMGQPTRLAIAIALAVGMPAAIVAPVLSEPAVAFLYGTSLAPAAEVLPIMAVQFAVFSVGLAGMPAIVNSERRAVLLWGSAAAVVVNALLCLIVVGRWHAIGAAAAALVAELAVSGVTLVHLAPLVGRLVDRAVLTWILFAALLLTLIAYAPVGLPPVTAASIGLAVYAVLIIVSGTFSSSGVRSPRALLGG